MGQALFPLEENDEKRIGAMLRRTVIAESKLLSAADKASRVARLSAPIVAQRTRRAIEFTFDLLDNDTVNAFALLGGHVFVDRGLLQLCREEAALQFVIAHEIAHVDLRHCNRGFNYAEHARKALGDVDTSLLFLAARLLGAGHAKQLEFEADRWAYRALRKVGRTHADACRGMELLVHYEAEHSRPPPGGPGASTPDSEIVRELDNHFRSHPPAVERLKRLQSLEGEQQL